MDETANRRLAGQLLASERSLVAAAPHWRSRMLEVIVRAFGRGLTPAHLARTLRRVLDEGEFEVHCEIVREAVRQAWADQRAGMCAECGADPSEHFADCSNVLLEVIPDEAEAEVRRLIATSLAEASAGSAAGLASQTVDGPRLTVDASTDPLQPYLNFEPWLEPDPEPGVVVRWLTGQIASRLVDISVDDVKGRRLALDRSASWWADQMPLEQRPSLELATAQLHLALSAPTRRAS